MMAHTHADFRYFWRLLSSESVLWTEMMPAGAVVQSANPEEDYGRGSRGIVAQLGGAEPKELAKAAAILRGLGYDSFNLNAGCPSRRVATEGRFGAALMREPEVVAECCRAIGPNTSVKHRLGVLEGWSREELWDYETTRESAFAFVNAVVEEGGVSRFIVHARIALLDSETSSRSASNGAPQRFPSSSRVAYKMARAQRLSTMANRNVPPLRPDIAHELKAAFPTADFILNGGVDSLDTALDAVQGLDGVMVGRALMSHPCAFADVDRRFCAAAVDDTRPKTRGEVFDRYVAYVEEKCALATRRLRDSELIHLVAPPFRLFNGEPGNGAYMRRLKSLAHTKLVPNRMISPANLLRAAKAELSHETLYEKPLVDFVPVVDLAAYDREVPRAGPLARLVV